MATCRTGLEIRELYQSGALSVQTFERVLEARAFRVRRDPEPSA